MKEEKEFYDNIVHFKFNYILIFLFIYFKYFIYNILIIIFFL